MKSLLNKQHYRYKMHTPLMKSTGYSHFIRAKLRPRDYKWCIFFTNHLNSALSFSFTGKVLENKTDITPNPPVFSYPS